ncbi:MAG: TetR/AcrR family transcriptional regulator [Fischerella sp. CENA71]|nr:TetR/AcrR family transcriptional regulator [Fischerella sp. CENA71]
MNAKGKSGESREQLLQLAEALFGERGYTAVTLRDIANAFKVRQAALYYHFPGGKEDLFVEVIKCSLMRHLDGLNRVISQAEPNLSSQLNQMADWLLAQPPLDLTRLARSDLPALSQEHSQVLQELGEVCLVKPIQQVLGQAYERGEIRLVDSKLMATVFLSLIDTVHDMHRYKNIPKQVLARDVIDILLDGMRRR